MTVTAIRRAAALAAAGVLAALSLTGCGFEAQNQNTDSGVQLRPSQVPTPPGFPDEEGAQPAER